MASGLVDDHGDQLFVPADAARTWQFRDRVNAKHGLTLRSYEDLYDWSTSHLADFWGDVWDETAIVGHKGAHVVDEAALPSANPNVRGIAFCRHGIAQNGATTGSGSKMRV
jgi:acetoacetyl-CoA synthetase